MKPLSKKRQLTVEQVSKLDNESLLEEYRSYNDEYCDDDFRDSQVELELRRRLKEIGFLT